MVYILLTIQKIYIYINIAQYMHFRFHYPEFKSISLGDSDLIKNQTQGGITYPFQIKDNFFWAYWRPRISHGRALCYKNAASLDIFPRWVMLLHGIK